MKPFAYMCIRCGRPRHKPTCSRCGHRRCVPRDFNAYPVADKGVRKCGCGEVTANRGGRCRKCLAIPAAPA